MVVRSFVRTERISTLFLGPSAVRSFVRTERVRPRYIRDDVAHKVRRYNDWGRRLQRSRCSRCSVGGRAGVASELASDAIASDGTPDTPTSHVNTSTRQRRTRGATLQRRRYSGSRTSSASHLSGHGPRTAAPHAPSCLPQAARLGAGWTSNSHRPCREEYNSEVICDERSGERLACASCS